jgi:hypothetical protein
MYLLSCFIFKICCVGVCSGHSSGNIHTFGQFPLFASPLNTSNLIFIRSLGGPYFTSIYVGQVMIMTTMTPTFVFHFKKYEKLGRNVELAFESTLADNSPF